MTARLNFIRNTPFGAPLNKAIYSLVDISAQMRRIKKIADVISVDGTRPDLLENSPEFGVATGQGAAFYAAIRDVNSSMVAITSLPSLDPGN